ncbi:MAG TPA: hypothetical protein VFQ36_17480 [Ktedonobacteraceae bacterium]|nr:hypothetical protein [Ktedonobacteraceae bacterium]
MRSFPFSTSERRKWDSFYAVSSALATLALIVLLIAMLRDTPSSFARMRRAPLEQDSGRTTPERATMR